jgi:hypothetical protein
MPVRDTAVINVVHEEDGVFANGTISCVDGQARAIWTFRQDGGEFTVENDVDDDAFDEIWDALNDPVFARHAVGGSDVKLDFLANYIVGVVFELGERAGQRTHQIPCGERDATWVGWLRRVEAMQRRS